MSQDKPNWCDMHNASRFLCACNHNSALDNMLEKLPVADVEKIKPVEVEVDGRDKWRDSVAALRGLADREESGEEAPIKRAAFIAQRADGTLAVHGIGPEADDMSLIALMSLGLQQIQTEMLY